MKKTKILITVSAIMVGVLISCSSEETTTTSSSCSSTVSSSNATTSATIDNKTASIGSDGCISGVSTAVDSCLPDWIKNNFKCQVAYVDGSNYVFKATNLPPNKSYYWAGKNNAAQGSQYALFQPLAAGKTSAGTNQISTQSLVYTIPSSASKNTGTLSGTQNGLAAIGITTDGLSIFNNAAAPGDTLASEVATFDQTNGHPESTGQYHHHQEPTNQTNNDASLVGIALDGYAIYGQKCDQGTSSTSDDVAPADLDSLHGHSAVTTHFSTATYHYHIAYDSTATVNTIMGSYFYGVIGSVTK